MIRPVRPEPVEIDGPEGRIEVSVEEPEDFLSDHVAVVCHPHPLYHGTMRNKVVHTVARAVNLMRRPAVRFNFRGVGASDGAYAEGVGETDDLLAVIEWVRRRWPGSGLWLAGFSFGSYVALRGAAQTETERLILVAPPVTRFAVAELEAPACPWAVIHGIDDELVDSTAVESWASGMQPAPILRLLPDTDHFFHGRLTLLRETVTAFLGEA